MFPSCVTYTLMEAAYCHSGQSFYLRNANLTVNTELPFIICFNTDDLGSSDSEHVMVQFDSNGKPEHRSFIVQT